MTKVQLLQGDCLDVLKTLAESSIDACVCDPPYDLTNRVVDVKRCAQCAVTLGGRDGNPDACPRCGGELVSNRRKASGGFMSQDWDATGVAFRPETWQEVLRVLKPGGHLLAFGSPRTYHRMACAIEDAGFEIRDSLMWVYGCLDAETECLTTRGWVRYDDLRESDTVFQWDATTNALSMTNPQEILVYPYAGMVERLVNRHTDQMLTPNHRVYAKIRKHSRNDKPTEFEVMEAQDLRRNWQITLPMAGVLDHEHTTGPTPEVAYIVGWYFTDAWLQGDEKAVMFSQAKTHTLARLREALRPYEPSEYVKVREHPNHNNEHTFYVNGELDAYLRSEFPERRIGWEIMGWSKDARQRLLDGLMDGDGTQPSDQYTHTFWSQDQERRDIVVALALSLGYRCYDSPENGSVYINLETSTTQLQSRHRVEPVYYKGDVWCLRVPTGAFVVRRNGRPFITGNSGFPKSQNVSKMFDKAAGAEREVVGVKPGHEGFANRSTQGHLGGKNTAFKEGFDRPWMQDDEARKNYHMQTAPATDLAKQWDGWGTALKSSYEIVVQAVKPLSEDQDRNNVIEYLLRLEAQLWSLFPANIAIEILKLSPADYDVVCAFAQWSAEEKHNTLDGLCETMDTQWYSWMANTCLSTVMSWNSILAENWKPTNTFTTREKGLSIAPTIDWRTLKSCLSGITPRCIIQAAMNPDGSRLLALPVARIFSAAAKSMNATQELFALENAIEQRVENYQEEIGLCPAHEPIVLARKPLVGRVIDNVAAYGTGAINIERCRIPITDGATMARNNKHGDNGWKNSSGGPNSAAIYGEPTGRWPANLILGCACEEGQGDRHDEDCPVAIMDAQSGERKAGGKVKGHEPSRTGQNGIYGTYGRVENAPYEDTGGASRFFYCTKATKKERNRFIEDGKNSHPTVKPLSLMRYLIRLVTPPGGTVLDPFLGSGTTGVAIIEENAEFDSDLGFIGIEREEEYMEIAQQRVYGAEEFWNAA